MCRCQRSNETKRKGKHMQVLAFSYEVDSYIHYNINDTKVNNILKKVENF